jgi:hypothetical protein
MTETESVCPACGNPLQRANAANGLRYQCAACQGVIITLAVFRRVLIEGVGSQLWVRSASQPANGHPCGFCTRAMRPTPMPGDTDHGATVEVCRVCESVWVPGDQVALLPTLGSAAGAPPAELRADRCPECGAPFKVAADGCCRYCHRQVEREPDVVFVNDGPGTSGPGHESGNLIGTAVGIALGFLFSG